MLKKWKKLEFLALTVMSVFTTTPIYAAHISLPVQPGELPVTNILVQNASAEEVFQQGLNFSAQKNMTAAEAAFRRVIQINPNFAEAYANLGSILANQNKLAEALPNFDNAIRIKPNVPEFHYMKGQVLYAQNKFSDAVESVKRAQDLFRKQGKTQEANTLEQVLKDMGSR
jgi:cytochrome c-type biogenesis protein CcmH/NrfG